jgi:cyclase
MLSEESPPSQSEQSLSFLKMRKMLWQELRRRLPMPRARWLTILLILVVPTVSLADDIFDFQPVAEGVVAAIAKPHRPANGNAAIILLDEGVLVVDAAATPSSARALIAEIKRLTSKPVIYVVNTHFHWDHFWGNQAFLDEWPGAEIVASESARRDMQELGLGSLQLQRWRVEIPALIETWKAALEKETDTARREQMRQRIEQWQAALPELKSIKLALPTLTFTHRLTIRRGSRTVEILWLGRGHAAGDVVVYLPKERIIASGDLLAGDTPYVAEVNPDEWARTLEAVEKLDFDYVIPGHGEVMRGKEHFALWKEYLRDLMAETAKAYAEGASSEAAKERVVPWLMEKYASRFAEDFPAAVAGNVERVYGIISGD